MGLLPAHEVLLPLELGLLAVEVLRVAVAVGVWARRRGRNDVEFGGGGGVHGAASTAALQAALRWAARMTRATKRGKERERE